jgi:peptidyl-prolyl cis-trans isomerase SurA
LIIHLLLFFPLNIAAEVVDKVVAVVNDDVITLSELEEEAAALYQSVARTNSDKPLIDALAEAREMTLDRMIDQHLIAQRARQYNVSVTEEEVESAFEGMRSKMSLSPLEFRQKLEESGLSENLYRKQLESQILQNKLLSYDVRSKIVITEDMILDYYDENYTSRVNEGHYYLLQMGFTWDTSTTDQGKQAIEKQDALQRATRVVKLVESGKDFRSLAQKFSDLPSAKDGGDIGSFSLDDMAQVMRDAVAPLKPGEISKVIETPAGYQFFKVLSNEKNAIVVTASYETVKEEIKEKLYQLKLQEAYSDWVRKLKENAYIQKI